MSQPSPYKLFDFFNSAYRIAALRAAIELDLFTAVGEGAVTVQQLAPRLQAAERGTRILCDTVAAMGFLRKTDGRYSLTEEAAAYLDRRSPCYMGDLGVMSMNAAAWPHLDKPAEAVRAGGAVTGDDADMEKESPDWAGFARAIAPMMIPVAESAAAVLLAQGTAGNVLEIGAGHALFGIAIARQSAKTRLTALDWPGVLTVACANADRAGILNRFDTIPGNAFAVPLGSGYDLVVAANFLHMFGKTAISGLLRKIRAALVPQGRFTMIDFVVNDDRVSPQISAIFAMIMLTATRDGDAYTFAELESMCLAAGFVRCSLQTLGDFEQRVVIAEVE
jgi:hypothetical protein